MRKLLLLVVMTAWLAAMSGNADAQLRVKDLSHGATAQQMVDKLLGGGVSVFNVHYSGSNNAAAVFCGGTNIVGFDTGILLTSGSAGNVVGPNNTSGASTDNGLPGDPSLDALIPGYSTFDAAILEFDFIPQGDHVQFNYVFGSEEYNEFVNSPFNDVFGFFVNGVNHALIPGTATPVAINNVNNGFHDTTGLATGPCVNCSFYIDNTGTNPVRNTQLDGLTVVLPMVAPVTAGAVNHLKMAIADTGDHVLDSAVFIQAGSLRSGTATPNCITRNALFWFTHAETNDSSCITLKAALQKAINVGCDELDLGFVSLPTLPRYGNVTETAELALIEALGFYWRGKNVTGEHGGTQSDHLPVSALCRARKQLAVEFIAATANNVLFGTDPSTCNYVSGKSKVSFPPDLIDQARAVAGGADVRQIKAMTALLHKFNGSGVTNDFPTGFNECSPNKRDVLRKLSRDATTQSNCPGLNQSCETALAIVVLPFNSTIDLSRYADSVASPSCAAGGANAVYKLSPPVAGTHRQFTASTPSSNFDTVLSVWSGTCSNLTPVACDASSQGGLPTQVSFTTDGTNTFYIVAEGVNGAIGRMKVHVTSP